MGTGADLEGISALDGRLWPDSDDLGGASSRRLCEIHRSWRVIETIIRQPI